WIKRAWDKAISGNINEENIVSHFLRPEKITQKHSEPAVAIQWGEHIQADPENRVTISFSGVEVPLYQVDLAIDDPGDEGEEYKIVLSCEPYNSCYGFIIDGRIPSAGFQYRHISGPAIHIKRGNRTPVALEEYLQGDPFIIQYVSGSFSYNCFLIKLPDFIGAYDTSQIEVWDWDGTTITKESMGKQRHEDSVQWRVAQDLMDSYDILIDDDGPGEAADLVALKFNENKINITLIHCKYSSAKEAGARVKDLYELCGQAQKSIRWKESKFSKLYNHIKQRNDRWGPDYTRFLKGGMPDLATIKRQSRTMPIVLEVILVQPGLSRQSMSTDMQRILGCTEHYLLNTAKANLTVIGSS
ncbi:hypothetical protein LJB86_04670, partial [Deltaproteobacteria bacterium OttesenSCG-928-M10]|nr:hypothetical protein [Deltaproteobacteria bacterium OttesenSCG-928-M10]